MNPSITLRPPTWGDVLVSEPIPDKQWVVPGLFERGDRLIVTGGEGEGKSTWLRQMCLQISNGLHPFSLEEIEPQRVFLLDLENSREQIKAELIKIASRASVDVPGDPYLAVADWPAGINLTNWQYEEALRSVLADYKPDIVIGGPLYKMADNSLSDETSSRLLAVALDRLRAEFNFALILEAHQVNESDAYDYKKKEWSHYRTRRPFGASLWRRWPEFGICLFKDGTLSHWRGQRQQREWPKRMFFDGETWIWSPVTGRCPICMREIPEGKQSYCTTQCRETAKKRRQRAGQKTLL